MTITHDTIIASDKNILIPGTFKNVDRWYDNEWGYSNRVVDLTMLIASKLGAGCSSQKVGSCS